MRRMTTNTGRDRPLILALRRNYPNSYDRNSGRSHIVRALTTHHRHPHIAPPIIDERAW